jgi:hypothetical protein
MTERCGCIAIMPTHVMIGGFESFQFKSTEDVRKGGEKFSVRKTEVGKSQ